MNDPGASHSPSLTIYAELDSKITTLPTMSGTRYHATKITSARSIFCTEKTLAHKEEQSNLWRRHTIFVSIGPRKPFLSLLLTKTFLNTLLVCSFDTGLSACILGKTALLLEFCLPCFSLLLVLNLGTWETGAKRKLGEPSGV